MRDQIGRFTTGLRQAARTYKSLQVTRYESFNENDRGI